MAADSPAVALSTPVPDSVQALYDTLEAGGWRLEADGYPVSRMVPDATFRDYEDYLRAEEYRRTAEWDAAGRPDDWNEHIRICFVGPTCPMSLMCKGVELIPQTWAERRWRQ